ncbi:MAG: MBOAT family O-acyltransferase [Niabella sp.]
MSFISLEFVLLFACTFLLFHAVNIRYRTYVLLAASAVFIGFYHIGFLITAILISLTSFFFGQWIDRADDGKLRKRRFVTGIIVLIGCWIAFRYDNYIIAFLRLLFPNKVPATSGLPSVFFPLGISFYTFQAISYLTEIYWQEEKPEKKLPDFLLYMLFFMKFLSGPIERSREMIPQIKSQHTVEYPSLIQGVQLITIGLVKKLILAGYIAPYIDGVFNATYSASGVQLLMASLLYPVELYGDFSGYTDMALGGALLFGFKLSSNFNRPFIAQTTSDFWRRWHMSLSFWVRDYLYMPLTATFRKWGEKGMFLSLFITFVGLGVWHGAGWHYVIYGAIQGAVICYEMKTRTFHKKLKDWMGSPFYATLSIIRTYLIFAVSLVFFRLESVGEALYYIRNISFHVNSDWKEINIGMPDHNCIVAGATLVLILLYEYFADKKDLPILLEKQPVYIRWTIYYLLVIALFTLGQFSSDNFIYLQF